MATFKTFEAINAWQNARVFWIANGAGAEVCSQLHNAKDIGYITDEQFQSIYDSAKQIGGMLFNLINVLSSDERRTRQ